MEFQPGIKILHQSGKVNIPADLLSRRADYLQVISFNDDDFMKKLKEVQEEAPELHRYREYAKGNHAGYRYKNGWLYTSDDQLVLPDSYLDLMCEEYHDRFGHMGV